jgi:hypothetical protein
MHHHRAIQAIYHHQVVECQFILCHGVTVTRPCMVVVAYTIAHRHAPVGRLYSLGLGSHWTNHHANGLPFAHIHRSHGQQGSLRPCLERPRVLLVRTRHQVVGEDQWCSPRRHGHDSTIHGHKRRRLGRTMPVHHARSLSERILVAWRHERTHMHHRVHGWRRCMLRQKMLRRLTPLQLQCIRLLRRRCACPRKRDLRRTRGRRPRRRHALHRGHLRRCRVSVERKLWGHGRA